MKHFILLLVPIIIFCSSCAVKSKSRIKVESISDSSSSTLNYIKDSSSYDHNQFTNVLSRQLYFELSFDSIITPNAKFYNVKSKRNESTQSIENQNKTSLTAQKDSMTHNQSQVNKRKNETKNDTLKWNNNYLILMAAIVAIIIIGVKIFLKKIN